MRFVYTGEQIEFIKSIAPGRYNDEIAAMFNERFNLNKTANAINSMKSNHGIKSGKLPKRSYPESKLFTDEQERFLLEHAEGLYNSELTDLMNWEFGLRMKVSQVKSWKSRNKVNSGISGRFKRGHEAWNKGMKGLNTGGERGWFKKGQAPLNYRPVGSERIDPKDGYIDVKVQDEGSYPERWRHKHVLVWERENGKVPKNHVIAFLNNDKTDVSLDNLVLLSRAELVRMNQNNYFSSDPEVTKAGIALVKLNEKITNIDLKGNDEAYFQQCVMKAEKNGIKKNTFITRVRRGWDLQDAAHKPLHARRKRRVLT